MTGLTPERILGAIVAAQDGLSSRRWSTANYEMGETALAKMTRVARCYIDRVSRAVWIRAAA